MSEETSPRKGIGRWLNMNLVGALLLVGATVISFWQVFNTQKELFDPDATIIRISHWQLERGYSDALQRVINEYEKMWAARGKKVRVLQQPVTEKVFDSALIVTVRSAIPSRVAIGVWRAPS